MTIPAYSNKIGTTSTRFESIPNHWQLMPCRAIVEEITEKNSDGTEQNYLSLMANVGVIKYEDKGDVGNKKPDDLTKCKIVRIGNLVINSMNYGIGSYGLSSFNGVCSPVYIVLNPIKGVLNERFALRIFEDKQFQSFAQSFGNGILAHRSAIGWDDLKQIEVPLPPLSEQTQIARFLDHETTKIDALIAEQKRLIKLLQEKRQAVISHAVTKGLDPNVPMKDSGVEWLGEVPAHWEVARMRFVCRITTGNRDTQDAEPEGTYPFFVRSDTIERSNGYCFDGEGVFTSGDGAGVGKIFHYYRGKCAIHQRVYLFHSFRLTTGKFFYRYLRSNLEPVVLSQSAKSTVDSLRLPMLQNFWMTIPPKNEQVDIDAFIEDLETKTCRLLTDCQSSIELLLERRSALISAAVTGKIDVRDWQPPADESAFDEDVRKAGMEASA